MKKNKVPVAIVGTGSVANSFHIPCWRKISEAEIIAVCDKNKETANSTAKRWRIPKVYTEFDELIEKEEKIIVDLCTPPHTHMPLSVKAMEFGHHVVLEKPMAMREEECEKILKTYQKKKNEVKLCVIHNWLFLPFMLNIKSILKNENVDILCVDIRMPHTPYEEMLSTKNHWVHSEPGGRLGECLIHPVYLLHDLLGNLEIRNIWVMKSGPYEWVKYDELFAVLNSNKKIGNIYISFNSPRGGLPLIKIYGKNLILDFDGTNFTRIIHRKMNESLIGRTIDSLSTSCQIINSSFQNVFKKLKGEWKEGHEYLFRDLVNSILRRKEITYPPEKAYEATKIFLEMVKKII
jgi:predicted dehydrogenase